jgi:hypothetical protein
MRARSFGLFHHGRSRTLVLCDLAFNFGPSSAFATPAAHEADPELCGLRPTQLDPLLTRDRRAAREACGASLPVISTGSSSPHREVLESGGHEVLRRGCAWLLAPRP